MTTTDTWTFATYAIADLGIELNSDEFITLLLKAGGSTSNATSTIERLYVSRKWNPYNGKYTGPGTFRSIFPINETPEWTQIPQIDSGQPKYLTEFIEWTVENVGQTNYFSLHLSGHGGGWGGLLPMPKQVWADALSLPDLQLALSDAGQTIDVLMFDNCNMGTIEVAYEVAPSTTYTVFTELEEVLYPGGKILTSMSASQNDPRTVAEAVPNELLSIMGAGDQVSVVESSLLQPVIDKTKDLVSCVLDLINQQDPDVMSALSSAAFTAEENTLTTSADFFSFVDQFKQNYTGSSTTLPAILNELAEFAPGQSGSPVIKNIMNKETQGLTGFSIYFPAKPIYNRPGVKEAYEALAFHKATNWGAVLSTYANS